MSKEKKYPCDDCDKDESCLRHGTHKRCKAWKEWFSEQWTKVRALFGVQCVNSTLKEKECDNEDS